MRPVMVMAVALWVTGCASLPSLERRVESHAYTDTAQTRLGAGLAPMAAAHPGQSGIHALPVPTDAFAARVVIAAAADKSLDVQYYIWREDETGVLLFEALWRAAERGVRVRLLLDDNNTRGMDEEIAALEAHRNIEVRLYNPVANRDARALALLGDFSRLNRRMHNKSFTADNLVTVVGGRNVGNEYFGAGDDTLFADLDVVATGAVVHEVSDAFDLYWNSASAYPAHLTVAAAPPDAAQRLEAKFAAMRASPTAQRYIEAVRATRLVQDLISGKPILEWTQAHAVRDDPAKTLDAEPQPGNLMITGLLRDFGKPEKTFDLVSPYFVPGKPGVEGLSALAQRGVQTRVLTNSLAATDVSAVHAGYEKSRVPLLKAGVHLYELKTTASAEKSEEKKKHGSSPESLHAKTFALDGRRIFVGSFNFDPRSALLNTEMGLVIDSPTLAGRLHTAIDKGMAENAYELRLTPSGEIEWVEHTATGEVVHDHDPATSALKRAWVQFLSWLPIDWLL